MEVGSLVEWSSQSNGSGPKKKQGPIVIVVPPSYRGTFEDLFRSKGLNLDLYNASKLSKGALYRDKESYIVAVNVGKRADTKPALYWPRASALVLAKQE